MESPDSVRKRSPFSWHAFWRFSQRKYRHVLFWLCCKSSNIAPHRCYEQRNDVPVCRQPPRSWQREHLPFDFLSLTLCHRWLPCGSAFPQHYTVVFPVCEKPREYPSQTLSRQLNTDIHSHFVFSIHKLKTVHGPSFRSNNNNIKKKKTYIFNFP